MIANRLSRIQLLSTRRCRSAAPDAPVVLLLHGWPDSVLRFERLLPLLTAYHVVVPALPGFPFAAPLTTTGMSVGRMAEVVAAAMDQLGYQRYTVSGGDVGGYIAEQSTRPNTLAAGLSDSPAGLAAWIAEKLIGWSDTTGGTDAAFSQDEILTWITAYWLTNTIGTSFSPYVEAARPADYVETPAVLSVFPHDIVPAPRGYAELFVNVQAYVEHAAGGHFAAWEQPAAYAADLDQAVRLGAASPARTGA